MKPPRFTVIDALLLGLVLAAAGGLRAGYLLKCIDETRDLPAQMILELRYVNRVDRLPTTEVAPPLFDLLLERYRMT